MEESSVGSDATNVVAYFDSSNESSDDETDATSIASDDGNKGAHRQPGAEDSGKKLALPPPNAWPRVKKRNYLHIPSMSFCAQRPDSTPKSIKMSASSRKRRNSRAVGYYTLSRCTWVRTKRRPVSAVPGVPALTVTDITGATWFLDDWKNYRPVDPAACRSWDDIVWAMASKCPGGVRRQMAPGMCKWKGCRMEKCTEDNCACAVLRWKKLFAHKAELQQDWARAKVTGLLTSLQIGSSTLGPQLGGHAAGLMNAHRGSECVVC